MFKENIEVIKETFSQFKGTGMFIALFLVSIIYIGFREKNKKVRNFMFYYSIITLIITLNPIFNKIIRPIFTDSVYWRVYWIIPLGVTIAYAAVKVINESEGKLQKVVIAISICLIIIISGKYIYVYENYVEVGNPFKIPDENLLITQIIGLDEAEYKKAIVPETMIAHVRQLDATIELAYRRVPQGIYHDNEIVQALNSGITKEIVKQANENNCNYVVTKKSVPLSEKMEDYDFVKINETPNFEVYKLQSK